MKILFLCLSTLKFDTTTPFSEPLGGTESALAYLAPEMVKLGHDVTLMCGTHAHVGEDGVKHCPVAEDMSAIGPDVVVVTSAPQAAPGIKKAAPNAKLVLWNHTVHGIPGVQVGGYGQESSNKGFLSSIVEFFSKPPAPPPISPDNYTFLRRLFQ